MLLNLHHDPHEQENLSEESPKLVEYARTILDKWEKEQTKDQDHGDPLAEVLIESLGKENDFYLKKLERTGRGQAVDNVRQICKQDASYCQEWLAQEGYDHSCQ
jgi:hypothetical protein